MADDRQEIVGKWIVRFQKWTWEYSFAGEGSVRWRDPFNNENGSDRWMKTGQLINLSWSGSTTKESWRCPIRPVDQTGWYSASYGTGPFIAEKVFAAPASPTDDNPDYTGLEPALDLPAGPPPEDIGGDWSARHCKAASGVDRGGALSFEDRGTS